MSEERRKRSSPETGTERVRRDGKVPPIPGQTVLGIPPSVRALMMMAYVEAFPETLRSRVDDLSSEGKILLLGQHLGNRFGFHRLRLHRLQSHISEIKTNLITHQISYTLFLVYTKY